MPDWVITLGINALVQLSRDPSGRSRWRKALMKVLREIARAFADDDEFRSIAASEFKLK